MPEMDFATVVTDDGNGNSAGGTGGGTLANNLTNETPPVVQPAGDNGTPVVQTTAPATTSTTPAPVPVTVPAGFWDKLKNTVGSAQAAVVAPTQAQFQRAAKAAGASDDTASKISTWAGPVLVAVVLAIAGTVYAFRRRIFSHKVAA